MEWNDNEKKIIGLLKQHIEHVDTKALWDDIKPNLPESKNNRWFPLFFCFLAGLGIGIGGYFIFDTSNNITNDKLNAQWVEEKHLLQKELELCKETKKEKMFELTSVNPKVRNTAQIPKIYPINSAQIAQKEESSENLNKFNIYSELPFASEKLLSTNTTLMDYEDDLSYDKTNHILLENKPILPLDYKNIILFEPILSKYRSPAKTKVLSYISAGGGLPFVHDKLNYEDQIQKSVHQPMYQYSLEYGFQTRWKKNWLLNVGFNYSGMASHIRYHSTTKEDLLITDTLGYYIGTDGAVSTETGDVLVTKIVSKTGKTYNYNHQLIIHPSIEYDIAMLGKSSISFKLGVMMPLISWQKNSYLNIDREVVRLPSEIKTFDRIFLRGGLIYNRILNNKTLGFYIDVQYGSQQIQSDIQNNVRTFFLPQTGMRILF